MVTLAVFVARVRKVVAEHGHNMVVKALGELGIGTKLLGLLKFSEEVTGSRQPRVVTQRLGIQKPEYLFSRSSWPFHLL